MRRFFLHTVAVSEGEPHSSLTSSYKPKSRREALASESASNGGREEVGQNNFLRGSRDAHGVLYGE